MATETLERKKVIIVGGGFGGIEAAKALADAPVDLTLIDRHNHHCFQPLLHQVATASLSPADIAWPIRSILADDKNITVLMAEVTAIDTDHKTVHAGGRDFPYDALILATGSTHSYFGNDHWAKHAPGLKWIEDATHIRRRILLAFEKAELTADEEERARLMTFVIVGGGPTGVEMAGAISEIAARILPGDFRHLDPKAARIILVEAGPRILPAFPENLSEYARRSLTDLGTTVITETAVSDIDEDGVTLKDGRIDTANIIWAAGVVASPAGKWLNAPVDKAGRVVVEPDLSVPGHPDIFVIGDTASVKTAEGKPVPGIAPAAKQMGQYVAKVLKARLSGKTHETFAYKHQGDLATIGRKSAIVKLKHRQLTGLVAWLFWGFVHVYFLIGIRNRLGVAWKWLWDYVTVQRGARLITRGSDANAPAPNSTERQHHDAAA